MFARRLAVCAVLAVAASTVAACTDDPPGRPTTVAEFDKHPCSLLTEEDLTEAIRPPYEDC